MATWLLNFVKSGTPQKKKLWSRRVLRPAAKRATGSRVDVTLYTLRHTHASALHYCGSTVPEAARRLGHGPGLHVETYAHVLAPCEASASAT